MLDVCPLLWGSCCRVLYLVSHQGFAINGKRIESVYFVVLGLFCLSPFDDYLCLVHLILLSFCHRLAQFLLTLFLCLTCSFLKTILIAGVLLHAILRKRSLRSKIAMRAVKLPVPFDFLAVLDSIPGSNCRGRKVILCHSLSHKKKVHLWELVTVAKVRQLFLGHKLPQIRRVISWRVVSVMLYYIIFELLFACLLLLDFLDYSTIRKPNEVIRSSRLYIIL